MKKRLVIATIAATLALTGCGSNEPAPYGQAYIDQRPDGWQQEDGEQAAADCRQQLAEDQGVELVTGSRGYTDRSYGSPTNIVVSGHAVIHEDGAHPRYGDRVRYFCEVNDPLGHRMVTVDIVP